MRPMHTIKVAYADQARPEAGWNFLDGVKYLHVLRLSATSAVKSSTRPSQISNSNFIPS